jgi:transposase
MRNVSARSIQPISSLEEGEEAAENIKAKEAMEVTDVLEEEAWKKSIALLRTIPGIGSLTASWLVLSTLNFTTCHSPQALVHYAGLAPIERTSGTSIRGRPQIGHSGNARLRTSLFMATLTAARFNPAIQVFWHRLREEENKPGKVARCACARKLLHLAYGIVKSGKPFEADYRPYGPHQGGRYNKKQAA